MSEPQQPGAVEQGPASAYADAGSTRLEAESGQPDVELDGDRSEEPYTVRRFLRELAIAAAILVVGVPLVLLGGKLLGDRSSDSTTSATGPTASPGGYDQRPLVFVSADLDSATTVAVAQASDVSDNADPIAARYPATAFATGTLEGRIAHDLASPEVAMVAVQAGDADVASSPGAAQSGAVALVEALRDAVSPSSAVTLVGPFLPATGDASRGLLRVRQELQLAAKTEKVHFVDPIELGLRPGADDLAQRLGAAIGQLTPRT